jgi:hypothetical protein
LRILQRINETAELSGWPVRLSWRGFARIDGDAAADVDPPTTLHIQQTMDSLLRRFERLESPRAPTHAADA